MFWLASSWPYHKQWAPTSPPFFLSHYPLFLLNLMDAFIIVLMESYCNCYMSVSPLILDCLKARAHVCFTILFNQTPNPPQLSGNMLWGGEGWWLDRCYRPHWWRCPLLHVGSKWLFFSLFSWRDGVLWSTGRWAFPAPAMEVAQWWHEEVVSDSPSDAIHRSGVFWRKHWESELI